MVTVGVMTPGTAQSCPLSGVLFMCAAEPIGRRLHETLARSRSGMARQCADDMAVLLRSARLLESLATTFAIAGRFAPAFAMAGLSEVVLLGSRRGEGERAEVQRMFAGVC